MPHEGDTNERFVDRADSAPGTVCRSLDHVAVAVQDLEEGIRWYCDVLGFELLERRRTDGARTAMISAVVRSGSAIVVLIQGTSPESQVSRFITEFGPGVQHMAFEVADLDVALERLASNGAALDVEVIEEPGIRQVFLRRDPGSGVRVELIQRLGGNFTDNSVERLFRAFEAHDLF